MCPVGRAACPSGLAPPGSDCLALAAQTAGLLSDRPAWTPATPVLDKGGDENWTVHGSPFTQRDACPLGAEMGDHACRMRRSVRTRLLRGRTAARRPRRLRQDAVVLCVPRTTYRCCIGGCSASAAGRR